LLVGEVSEIGGDPMRQHGSNFAQGERAGDVQEVAHVVGSRESGVGRLARER
jgi:hypothetical protein